MGRLGRTLIQKLHSSLSEDVSTWKLYKNKPFFKRLSHVLYTSQLLNPFFDVYYKLNSFYNNICRVVEYAPIVWKHRNWDYGFILEFNKKLHEDLYKGVYEKGHHVFTKKDSRRLKTVIALYKRIHDDDYVTWSHDYLEKKYGRNEMVFEPIDDKKGYSRLRFSLDEKLTPEQKKCYDRDRKALYKLEEIQRKQDLKLLGEYIAKYSRKWWD